MPIVDVELVGESATAVGGESAQALADTLGRVLGSAPGRTWVRLRRLAARDYAENATTLDAAALPVFVTILHAHPPAGTALIAEVSALTEAVATCLKMSPGQVHVQYAPPGAGRQAFGGKLVE